MKKFFKALLLVIATLAVLAGIAALYISFRSIPKYTPEKKTVHIDYTPARVAQGVRLASMLCKSCHYNEQTQKFTGREMTEVTMFGKIFSKNITHAGIGQWSDGDLLYFIRTGVRPDGQYVPPYMPKLIHISDEDLYSIISFLRSDNAWVMPDTTHMPDTKPSFFTKFLVTIGAAKPFPFPEGPIAEPDTTDKVKWGRYIAVNQLECYSCHSQDFAKNDYFSPEQSPGYFGGGNKMYDLQGREMRTLNITMDPETGIGRWTEDDFVQAVRFGQLPGHQPALRYPMQPYSQLGEAEVKAIYAYLKSIPPITNKVNRNLYE